MDLSIPKELTDFAAEVRAFIRAELPDDIREKVIGRRFDMLSADEKRFWQRKMVAKGWGAPAWPVAYGGTDWDVLKRHTFNEVVADEGAPMPVPFGQGMLAPILIEFGSEEQRQHYLPRILNLEYFFCQGFSEPGSGSDLASLKTKAVRDGEDWIVSGQKMWTSYAHQANMMFCLVRTDPEAERPQQGISMLLIPMDDPGITVRPVITLDGEHHTNEVFLDDVRVPGANLVGEVNKGWTYAKALLGYERTEVARIGLSKRLLKMVKEQAAKRTVNGVPLTETPVFRRKLASLEIELKAVELLNLRMLSNVRRNLPGNEANMLKIKGSELQQDLTELAMEAQGTDALRFDRNAALGQNIGLFGDVDYRGDVTANYLATRVITIFSGSNEIQHNILAKELLDL